ncbi:hypothetical protein KRX54_04560 [Actinomycetaceae bacterium TAE3-ERU4]|nr:hypothetical protein [Actinomycetaceae bacterium TAE3-ERU4]
MSWFVIWLLLIISASFLVIATSIWVLFQLFSSFKLLRKTFSALEWKDSPHRTSNLNAFPPGPALGELERAQVLLKRLDVKRNRLDKKLKKTNIALQRWEKLGLLGQDENSYSPRVCKRGSQYSA